MLSWRIALRYFFRRKTHNAVNVISTVALIGIAVASAAMVCVLSVFNGFSDLSDTLGSRLNPDYALTPIRGKTLKGDSLAAATGGVCVLTERALAVSGDRQHSVTLMGVGPGWDRLTGIREQIIDGIYPAEAIDAGEPMAAAHAGVAIDLMMRPGPDSWIELYVPRRRGNINPANPAAAFRTDTVRMEAVYQLEYGDTKTDLIILPIERLRRMLDYTEGEASYVAVSGNRPADGEGYAVLDRRAQTADSAGIIEVEKWITFLMLAFIMVIASFNIISTLSMMVIEKERSMAILRALGMERGRVRRIFVIEGWLIGVVGGIIGIIAGCILTLVQQWGGIIQLGGDHAMMAVTAYPVRLAPLDILAVLATVTVVGLLTGLVSLAVTRARA